MIKTNSAENASIIKFSFNAKIRPLLLNRRTTHHPPAPKTVAPNTKNNWTSFLAGEIRDKKPNTSGIESNPKIVIRLSFQTCQIISIYSVKRITNFKNKNPHHDSADQHVKENAQFN